MIGPRAPRGPLDGDHESAVLEPREVAAVRVASPLAVLVVSGHPGERFSRAFPGHPDGRGDLPPGHGPPLVQRVRDLHGPRREVVGPAPLAGVLPKTLGPQLGQRSDPFPSQLPTHHLFHATAAVLAQCIGRQPQPAADLADRVSFRIGPMRLVGLGNLLIAPAERMAPADECRQVPAIERGDPFRDPEPVRGLADLLGRQLEPLGAPGGAVGLVMDPQKPPLVRRQNAAAAGRFGRSVFHFGTSAETPGTSAAVKRGISIRIRASTPPGAVARACSTWRRSPAAPSGPRRA